jgi:hypothetical protein
MRRFLVILPVLFVSACGGGRAATSVTVVAHGINGNTPWHTTWTLKCSPAGGSHPKPGKACSALADLVRRHAVPPRHCHHAIEGPWTTVRGTYNGHSVALAFAEACATTSRDSLDAQALGMYFSHG